MGLHYIVRGEGVKIASHWQFSINPIDLEGMVKGINIQDFHGLAEVVGSNLLEIFCLITFIHLSLLRM